MYKLRVQLVLEIVPEDGGNYETVQICDTALNYKKLQSVAAMVDQIQEFIKNPERTGA